MKALPDTGCTATIISQKLAKEHNLEYIFSSNDKLVSTNNEDMKCIGVTYLQVCLLYTSDAADE